MSGIRALANSDGLFNKIYANMQGRASQAAQFDDGAEVSVITLTTSEKGILGRIADAVRVFFGMRGEIGSVADLTYCLNQLKQHVIIQTNRHMALSQRDAPLADFRTALSARFTLLTTRPASDKAMTLYARQLCKDTLGEAFDAKAVDGLIKMVFTVDKKGYSKKAKIAMGIAAAALIGAAAYYGYKMRVPQMKTADTEPRLKNTGNPPRFRQSFCETARTPTLCQNVCQSNCETSDDPALCQLLKSVQEKDADERLLNKACEDWFTQPEGVSLRYADCVPESIFSRSFFGVPENELRDGDLSKTFRLKLKSTDFKGQSSFKIKDYISCRAILTSEGANSIKSQLPASCENPSSVIVESEGVKGRLCWPSKRL